MEYTLQDSYEALKDLEADLQRELDQISDAIANNRIDSLNQSVTPQDVQKRQLKFTRNLIEQTAQKEILEYPLPGTADLHSEVLQDLKNEVNRMESARDFMQAELKNVEDDISYLKNKKDGLRKMEDACLEAFKIAESDTYTDQLVITKRIFQSTKKDLYAVVDALFPNADDLKELLADLSSALTKGGDDTYVDVTSNVIDYIAFLLEADIIQYHRNDRRKIKFTEML